MVSAKKITKFCLKHGRLILQDSGPRIPVFYKKKDLKKNLPSASDHKDVFLDRPALIFIVYIVFYFILLAFYLETTAHLSFITK